MPRVAIIGLGEIGRVYAKAVQECSSASVSVACDSSEEQRAWAEDALGVPTVAGFEAALERDDVDVVAICLPHDLHYPVAMAALSAGKHVLLEKPMATTVDECDRLCEAADKAGLTIGVNHNRLFVPSHIKARELIEAGEIGEPVLLRQRLGIHEPYVGWRADPEKSGGGLLSDAGAHPFYIARYLFGDVVSVRSMLDVPGPEGESLALVWMEFESGAHGLLEATYWGPAGMFDDSVEVIGSEGLLRLGGLEAATWGYRPEPPLERYRERSWQTDDVELIDWERSVILSVKAYLEALDAGEPVPVSGLDGREDVRLIQAAYSNAVLVGKFTRPSLARK